MRTCFVGLFIASTLGLLILGPAGCAGRGESTAQTFPDAASLPEQIQLPDALTLIDGKRVSSKSEWEKRRRPELRRLFEHYMYGSIPPAPNNMKINVLGQYPDFLDGNATLKLVRLETGPAPAPQIDLMLVVPNKKAHPAPVFLTMNFCGNQALTTDPRVSLAHSWVGNGCAASGNRADDASRGAQATNWPLAEIIGRGYALASFYSGDVDPDRRDASIGIYEWLAHGNPNLNNPTNRGTIAAWAWGFQRCVDYLVKDADVDPKRIAALGHSRNGKTALLAAAFDDRIAMAFPHQAGCGGSAPSRGKTGESVKAINTQFPHWFNGEFKKFNDEPQKLPFDQNCLVALCAPRPILFSAAEGDQWANPAGQFEVLKAADPVYRFLGVEGLAAQQMPPHGKLIASRLGYYIREGKHAMTSDDWGVFLDFADAQWK